MKQTRREMIVQAGAMAATGSLVTSLAQADAAVPPKGKFAPLRYCLNTSTIRGQKLTLDKEIDLIAEAGYQGIEPWIREIQQYKDSGGKLSDLKKRLDDHGLQVEGAIGFATWIVDDDAKRKEGLETLKRDMDMLRQIGGVRIAAPPVGATKEPVNLDRAAERYAEALKVGRSVGVLPLVELWGFSKSLHRLGELMYVAVECGDPDAALLLDVYHIYKGGSDFKGLGLVDGSAVKVLHMNDYPDMDRTTIADKDRVYPGDGVGPVSDVLNTLTATGFEGVLSLELFNPTYWKQDAATVLKKGLASMKEAVAKASQANA